MDMRKINRLQRSRKFRSAVKARIAKRKLRTRKKNLTFAERFGMYAESSGYSSSTPDFGEIGKIISDADFGEIEKRMVIIDYKEGPLKP